MTSAIHTSSEFPGQAVAREHIWNRLSRPVVFIDPSDAVATRVRLSRSHIRGCHACTGHRRASRHGLRPDVSRPDQIVSNHHAKEVVSNTLQPSELRPAQADNVLGAAKGLFGSFTRPLAECVAGGRVALSSITEPLGRLRFQGMYRVMLTLRRYETKPRVSYPWSAHSVAPGFC